MSDLEQTDEGIGTAIIETLMRTYEGYHRSLFIRILAQLHPFSAAADSGMSALYATLTEHEERNANLFRDDLISLNLRLSEEDVRKREFFEASVSTMRRVLSESRDKKIKLFAQLFAGFVAGGCSASIDRYEEHLQTLDMLSEREFELLSLLWRHECSGAPEEGENPIQRASRHWDAFQEDACEKLGICGASLPAILGRIARTGLYLEITGSFWGYKGGKGFLTPEFDEFRKALRLG